MEINQTTENKSGFFRNDRRLVCGMLVVYGVCIMGAIVATFWWLNQRQQTLNANATATGAAVATQKAIATSTAIARATEQAQYEFVERFDATSEHCISGQRKMNIGKVQSVLRMVFTFGM